MGVKRLSIIFLAATVLVVGSVVAIKGANVYAARGGGGNCTDGSSPAPNDQEYFPFRFICGGQGDDYTHVYLQGANGTPNGNETETLTGADYTVVPGDSNMDIMTGFTTNAFGRSSEGSMSSKNVYVFTTIDIDNDMIESLQFLPSQDNDGGGNIVERKYDACPGSGSAFPVGTPISGQYTNTPGAVYSSTRIINPLLPYDGIATGSQNASPYSTLASDEAQVNCGAEGKMMVWKLNNLPANFNQKNPRFHFRMKLSNKIPGGVDGLFCLRTNISVQYDGYDYTTSLAQIAKKSKRQCYKVVRRTVQGQATSSTTNATGKGLGGIPITYNRNCDLDPAHNQTATTNSAGVYQFDTTVGQNTCLSPPGSTSSGGTNYNSPSPSSYLGNSVNACIINPCGGFNFVYEPIAQNPGITKTASPGTGTSVKPGDRIDYTVTLTNNLDANLPNVRFDDWVPLNMRQNIAIDGIDLATNNGPTGTERPGGWSANPYGTGLGVCPSLGTPLVYGDGSPTHLASASCATSVGGVNSPPRIAFQLSKMPAYSTLTIRWHGFVKQAKDVGVYMSTSTGNYCTTTRFYQGAWWLGVDHPEYGADFSQPGVYAGCENKSVGLQGVTNWAAVQMNNNSAISSLASDPPSSSLSNNTYHPIPGAVSCVSKSALAEFDPNGTSAGSACGIPYQSYIWSERTDLPSYSQAIMKIRAFPDLTAGPIEYYVRDQATSGLSTNMSAMAGGYQPDRNYNYSAGDDNPGGLLRWGITCLQRWPENNCAAAATPLESFDTPEYRFRVAFNNSNNLPYGSVISNNARVCWKEYWLSPVPSGYPESCATSNTVDFRRVKIDQPFYDTALGGIQAGGGVSANTAGPCTLDSIGDYTLKNNPSGGRGNGWFMVSTVDPDGPINLDSLSGITASGPTAAQCRPDLAQRSESLLVRPGGAYRGPARSSFSGSDTSLPDINNKIMTFNSPSPGSRFVLGSNTALNGSGLTNGSVGSSSDTVINKRWTLYVDGDLYIAGNVRYQDADGNKFGVSPSFGVVVTGNIYVDPAVTRLDGYYYAQGRTLTGGTINTCSAQVTPPVTAGTNIKTLSRGYKVDGVADLQIPPTAGYSVTQCSNNLRVNGIMFGRSFRFNRVPKSAPDQPSIKSEEIVFSNRLILATPPAFSDLAAQYVRTNYQGERQPRF
ncbi:DUF11 domain-containing protein [Patescibacteria group bacterium]|nr:MAG: DUF11 domain-containing protein [Patescibacteria group bacterium]